MSNAIQHSTAAIDGITGRLGQLAYIERVA
jgi:hypothetical protein